MTAATITVPPNHRMSTAAMIMGRPKIRRTPDIISTPAGWKRSFVTLCVIEPGRLIAAPSTPASLVRQQRYLSQHIHLFAANLDATCALIWQWGGNFVIRVHQADTGIT